MEGRQGVADARVGHGEALWIVNAGKGRTALSRRARWYRRNGSCRAPTIISRSLRAKWEGQRGTHHHRRFGDHCHSLISRPDGLGWHGTNRQASRVDSAIMVVYEMELHDIQI
jgi:hypothetical protein